MKTNIKEDGDIIIVSMDGHLDFENQISLHENLMGIAQQAHSDKTPKKLIFNLQNLNFVGSSGISAFIQTLKAVNATAQIKPKYCHVKTEFQKIIRAFDAAESEFEFFEDIDHALDH